MAPVKRLILLPILIAAPAAFAGTLADVVSAPAAPRGYTLPERNIAAVPARAPAPAPAPRMMLAQYYQDEVSPVYEDELDELQEELLRLQQDRRVRRFAPDELARAEEFIEDLVTWQPGRLQRADLDQAQELIDEARDVALAQRGDGRRGDYGRDREVIVVDDDDDDLAREDAERARADADRARFDAEAAREAAEAARREVAEERGRYDEMEEELKAMKPRETERGLMVTLGDVLFEVDRADLRPAAIRTLYTLVSTMKEHTDTTVVIEGHTDSTGKKAYNYTLSERRANTVRSFLTRNGIAARRIQTAGLGPDAPVASNATASGRAQNRRVEVILQDERERAEGRQVSRR